MRTAETQHGQWLLAGLLTLVSLVTGCGGQVATTGTGSSGSSSTSSSNGSGSDAVSISGTPATSVEVGHAYSFQPTASGSSGTTLSYSISNMPSWANFSAATGALAGTPTVAETGAYSDIVITVTDGTHTASLPSFAITVEASGTGTGTASLSWLPPTENTDGTPVADLAGYRVYYGTSSEALTQTVDVIGSNATSYVVTGLSAGTYYFAVTALSSDGLESVPSDTASKTI